MINEHLEMVELLIAESQERQLDEIKKIPRNVKVATKPGHKMVDGREVKMAASERLNRKLGSKRIS